MSLMTRCPSCTTQFRVTQEQLQAHGGRVRCGQCKSVFDAYQALAAVPDAGSPPVAAAGGAESAASWPEQGGTAQPAAAGHEGRDYEAGADWAPYEDPVRADPEAQRRARRWAAGAAALALLLAGQAAYFHRSDLSAQYPVLRPYLVSLCEFLGCSVLPPQRPKQIAIEASDLQATNSARPGLIQLTATLRNHAGHDLAYPALDLVLTDTKEHALARRIFVPREYLERGRDVSQGIAAHAELTVRLDLDTGELNPAGFRLDLMAAPAP